jgi:fermentation-respiration switch protein FrsA (DUF1100 family)
VNSGNVSAALPGRTRKLVVLCGAVASLALAPSAGAAIPSAFGGDAPCAAESGVRLCAGVTETFDGVTNIDVNLILPPEPASGGDGPYPAIGFFHGWGGSKIGINDRTKDWASRGYAVFSMSDRGWGNSCGGLDPQRITDPAGCARGYNHLMDTRYEVRDAQHLLGVLANEGAIMPKRIGVTGGSYGGGISMALAALRNRTMIENADGSDSIVPWTSPAPQSLEMEIAAAAPDIPWTDLAYSLAPNGGTLDYVADSTYMGRVDRIGVMKQSFVTGLFAIGQATSNYAPLGTDDDADLQKWYALFTAGEPYDGNPLAEDIADELTTHHSSYYIDHSIPPAPLLISNGWTDDLFPPDEAIRFYNRTRSQYPDAPVSLFFSDHGHQRGQNKDADSERLVAAQNTWLDYYVKGVGPTPFEGVTTLTQTCPGDAPSGGPFTARSWPEISPGEVRFAEPESKLIAPVATNPETAQAFDPIAGGGACATTSSEDAPGTATYRLPAAPAGGYTLMGSPTVNADITAAGLSSQIAARLLDVAPSGEQTLVARGLWRPEAEGRQTFQLHPNGWKFEQGHIAKLELLSADTPYGRVSNGQVSVTIANLDLRLPVLERPGAAGGAVVEPGPQVVPEGAAPAPGVDAAGRCETGIESKGTRADERIVGSAGGDRLRGGGGNDRISGKGGDDCVRGNRGKDRLSGGGGNDRLAARDGERERIRCGKGKDTAVVDRIDRVRGCEKRKVGRGGR